MIKKTIFVPGKDKQLEDNINKIIKELAKSSYQVLTINNTDSGVLLGIDTVNTRDHGYQPKALSDSNMATPKQINYIKRLASQAGEEIDTANLTKSQAGPLIGKLKKEVKQGKAQSQPESDDNFEPSFSMDNLEGLLDD